MVEILRWRFVATRLALVVGIGICLKAAPAAADPCGMVPPIWTGQGPAITRVGEQMTYVFFKDGIETFVIRPGFSGKVDNFGMLIPFPSPPAIRKVPDDIFKQIAAAIDPPEVTIDMRPRPPRKHSRRRSRSKPSSSGKAGGLAYDAVRVIKQEAVGMYEVAVLEAGSPRALKRWMDQNGFVYPKGMDVAVGDYVDLRWAFVVVKTRVGSKSQVKPKPGMRKADATLPPGSSFDGKVQAMGFRFEVESPVVPMRLSAFNEGQLRNIVYFITDRPVRIVELEKTLVRRQVSGKALFANLTQLRPVRIFGGTLLDISRQAFDRFDAMRDPAPFNAQARALFAADLYAVKRHKLALPFEEREKVLLRIGETLNLRGAAIDQLHQKALVIERDQTLGDALKAVTGMTMTVVDGDFPRDTIAANNLTFKRFTMPKPKNSREHYDARIKGPAGKQGGELVTGNRRPPDGHPGDPGKMRWIRSW